MSADPEVIAAVEGKCPKNCICGAEQVKNDGGKSWKVYECLTFCHGGKFNNRTADCYTRQLVQQAGLLRKTKGAIINLIEWVRLDMIEMQREGHVISHLAIACDESQALLSDIEKALEKVK